jgi:protoheme IX farnesyltransferase
VSHRFPTPVRTHERFSWLLGATAIGAYLLVAVGATTAVTDAGAACSTWPACAGGPAAVAEDPALAIAWGHRLAAALVGIAVVASAVAALLGDVRDRTLAALLIAAALYPMQVAIGALAATASLGPALSAVHLLVGLVIFVATMAALTWALEADTARPEDREPIAGPDPEPASEPAPEAADADGEFALPDGRLARAKLTAKAYLELTKPRLMWLLCLVAAAAMALAAATVGSPLTPRAVGATMLGGVLSIGASGTFNHVLERDVDRRMNRTSDRPLAVDLVSVRNAVAFGLLLAAGSLAAFASLNLLAAVLGLVAILFYSVVYTLVLKPNTVQNTVIGGAAGALPALIGWAAVTGEVGVPGLALAGVIFLWTPAHFYNLALAYKDDYARGGFPMMPVVRGEVVTRRHICWYFAATLVGAAALSAVATLGPLYAAVTAAVGAVFLWAIVRLHRERTEAAAFRAFHASNAFLGALLVTVVVDALVI